MNGYECGGCGCHPCICSKIKEDERIREGKEVIETAWHVFVTTSKWKRKLIRWFWPDIMHVIEAMQRYYWK